MRNEHHAAHNLDRWLAEVWRNVDSGPHRLTFQRSAHGVFSLFTLSYCQTNATIEYNTKILKSKYEMVF
jgi:hypothetical protein